MGLEVTDHDEVVIDLFPGFLFRNRKMAGEIGVDLFLVLVGFFRRHAGCEMKNLFSLEQQVQCEIDQCRTFAHTGTGYEQAHPRIWRTALRFQLA